MKNQTLLVLAALCLFAQATTVFKTPAFLELKKNPLGLALTNMVQVTMQSKQASGRLDAINNVLNEVARSLAQQQESNENNFQIQQAQHNNLVENLTGQLNVANQDLAHFQEEQRDLAAEEVQTESALAQEQDNLQSNTQSRNNAQQQVVDENERNEQAVREYAEAIQACEQSVSLLSTLVTVPQSFLQTQASFNNVVALLSKNLKKQQSPLVVPVISVLSELAVSSKEVNQSQLNKIINLINQLLEELRNQQAQNVVNHNQAIENLNNQIDSLNNLIASNEAAIEQFNNRLDAIDNRQSQLSDIISNLEALIPVLEASIDQANAEFAQQQDQYNHVKVQLNHDVDGLEKVREYFNNHIVASVQNIDNDVYNDQLSA